MRRFEYKWNPEREELWIYVYGRKKFGKLYKFKLPPDNCKNTDYPCNFCILYQKCTDRKNPLIEKKDNRPDSTFASFCNLITLRNPKIQAFSDRISELVCFKI